MVCKHPATSKPMIDRGNTSGEVEAQHQARFEFESTRLTRPGSKCNYHRASSAKRKSPTKKVSKMFPHELGLSVPGTVGARHHGAVESISYTRDMGNKNYVWQSA